MNPSIDEAAAEREAIQAEPSLLTVTLFPNARAKRKQESRLAWEQLVEKVRNPKHYPTKAAMPLLKLARFGDLRSDKNCLRHDANLLAVGGIETDYDGEAVSLADGATLLAESGAHAVLYSSPSSTPDKPRWRALFPLAHEHPPGERRELVGRVNRILDGILAAESFTLSQSYYIGKADDAAHYEAQEVRGERYLDEITNVEPQYPANGAAGASAAADALNDSLLLALQKRNLVKGPIKPGTWGIVCPWEHEHTGPAGTSDTAYLQASFEGRSLAGFKCMHGHCQGRTLRDLRAFLGVGENEAPQVDDEPSAANGWPEPINLVMLAEHAPQTPRFILRDWLPAGYATLLAGHGGVGKSAIGLHVAACIGLGAPFFGVECERHRVLYLSCEDRTAVLHWRLHHLCAFRHIALAELHDSLDVLDLVGRDTVLWDRDPRTGYTVTPAFGQLAQRIEQSRSQVLVVDGVSDTFGGNENARPDVKRFVNALLSLLPDDGALLLLGHVNRPAASNPSTSEGYSGSTQWHNAVRARWYLYPETEQDDRDRPQRSGRLLLELQKSNLGAVQPAMTFKYDEEAKLFVGIDLGTGGGLVDSIREGTERRSILRAMLGCEAAGISVPAAMQGPRTAYLVLTQRPEFPDSMRGSARAKTRRFARHLETLRQIRHIGEDSIRRSNRHSSATLVLTSEGRAECANT